MKCSECKFFEFKKIPSWLKWTGEFKWGYCHNIPQQTPTYLDGWCSSFEHNK